MEPSEDVVGLVGVWMVLLGAFLVACGVSNAVNGAGWLHGVWRVVLVPGQVLAGLVLVPVGAVVLVAA